MRSGRLNIGSLASDASANNAQPEAAATTNTDGLRMYLWGGRQHIVPHDWSLPTGDLRQAFTAFVCANDEKHYPPLRFVTTKSLHDSVTKDHFSAYSSTMNIIVNLVKKHADLEWVANPDQSTATHWFDTVYYSLGIATTTDSGRSRSRNCAWITLVKEIRKHSKMLASQQ